MTTFEGRPWKRKLKGGNHLTRKRFPWSDSAPADDPSSERMFAIQLDFALIQKDHQGSRSRWLTGTCALYDRWCHAHLMFALGTAKTICYGDGPAAWNIGKDIIFHNFLIPNFHSRPNASSLLLSRTDESLRSFTRRRTKLQIHLHTKYCSATYGCTDESIFFDSQERFFGGYYGVKTMLINWTSSQSPKGKMKTEN